MRTRVILGLKTDRLLVFQAQAEAIYGGLSTHPSMFVDPNPPLPILRKQLDAFAEAQRLVGTRERTAAATRDLRGAELLGSLENARAYVQELCDETPEQAAALAAAASMKIGRPPSHPTPWLKARQPNPGSPVEIIAHAALLTRGMRGKVFFNWQLSADGGDTWTDLPSTPYARTEIADLTALRTYTVRVSATNWEGSGPWSQALTFLVH